MPFFAGQIVAHAEKTETRWLGKPAENRRTEEIPPREEIIAVCG